MKTVVIGLSGGVDSSVAAYVLKQQGYEVLGLFMKNWHDTTGVLKADCPWLDDKFDAEAVARKLDIPFHFVDLSTHYRARVVDYMFAEYEKGRTPNPDVLCNREIKFDIFLKTAMDLGADYVATGHYARKEEIEVDGQKVYRLLAGKDKNKDQSYFLCQLNQEQLSKSLFPIGELEKSEVRKIAKEQDLVTADKKDSQGLCFIGKVSLPEFLQQQLKPKSGEIIEISKEHSVYNQEIPTFNSKWDELSYKAENRQYEKSFGKVVGQHDGAHYFTKGQRKGLRVGGTPEPLFVIDTNVDENIIYTGQGKQHPGLYRSGLFVKSDEIHWIREDLELQENETMEVMARIRYRQRLEKAVLHRTFSGLYVIFEKPQSAITEGQFVAWYRDSELLGSGVIS